MLVEFKMPKGCELKLPEGYICCFKGSPDEYSVAVSAVREESERTAMNWIGHGGRIYCHAANNMRARMAIHNAKCLAA